MEVDQASKTYKENPEYLTLKKRARVLIFELSDLILLMLPSMKQPLLTDL